MEKKLTPELKLCKEELDFLNKKIGELEWQIATIFYGRKAISNSERKSLEYMIENYIDNKEILLEKIRNQVREANKSK